MLINLYFNGEGWKLKQIYNTFNSKRNIEVEFKKQSWAG